LTTNNKIFIIQIFQSLDNIFEYDLAKKFLFLRYFSIKLKLRVQKFNEYLHAKLNILLF